MPPLRGGQRKGRQTGAPLADDKPSQRKTLAPGFDDFASCPMRDGPLSLQYLVDQHRRTPKKGRRFFSATRPIDKSFEFIHGPIIYATVAIESRQG